MAHIILWNSFAHPSAAEHNLIGSSFSALRPVGPHQLASWLTNFGYDVKVIDFCNMLSTKDLVAITERHVDSRTVAIGASTTFWRSSDDNGTFEEPDWAIAARKNVQERHPQLDWLLGGPRVGKNSALNLLFRFKWTKFRNHAEDELLKYIDEKVGNKTSRQLFDIKTLQRHFTDGLGIAPHEVLPIELGRGCQFKCSFCRFPLLGKKKGTYIREYQLIEDELRSNYDRYGTTRYFFVDDTVNESEEKVIALAEMANRLPFKLEWVGYNRLDLIWSRPHTAELLQQSGLRSAFFGIESFHPAASRYAGKGWNGKYAKDYLLELRERWKKDTTWSLSFLVGLPGEDEKSIDASHQWCIDNDMHHWLWHGLHIDKSLTVTSEFDRKYAEYGYSFPDPSRDYYWTHDLWNAETAQVKADQLKHDANTNHNKLAGWLLGQFVSAGYDFKNLMFTPLSQLDYPTFETQTLQFVERYVQFQLNN
jgi:hypothetical protein